jgi:hypothetical protein
MNTVDDLISAEMTSCDNFAESPTYRLRRAESTNQTSMTILV